MLISIIEGKPRYEISVIHGIGQGKIAWAGSWVIVMLTVGREKLVKYVGLRVYETSKQSVIIVIDELCSRWSGL